MAEKKKKVLLALGNEKFNLILRKSLEEHFTVLKDEVYSFKYLEELIEESKPDIIILHDYYLASEQTEPYEREKEWLHTVENVRRVYDDKKRLVFICERKQGDPFLSEMINRNVLDIFHTRSLDVERIIEQLLDQPRYSKVAYLKVEGSNKRYGEGEGYTSTPIFEGDSNEVHTEKEVEPEEEEENKEKKELRFSLPNIPKPKITTPKIPLPKKSKKKEIDLKPEIKAQEYEDFEESDVAEDSKQKNLFNLFGGGKKSTKDYNIQTIRPRLIAVGSLHPGAGSTFFLHNFTRYLSDKGISSCVLEGLNDVDALFALAGSEEPPNFEWESLHNIVLEENHRQLYSLPKWNIEGTIFMPTLNVDLERFEQTYAKDLVYFARQSPLVFVDISHNWTDFISKEVLGMCDELWCITEPNPMYLEVQRKHHQFIFQVSDRVGEDNVIVLGNKWGNGVDISRFPELYVRIPYIQENPKALSNNMPVYRMKPKGLSGEFLKLYKRLSESIV
ncbi:hypothetical protein [Virgibacillus halodenitrificans]|uniref:hypothetical protein n=1 Tax=Virgibacillus halodenitrificans TaxID=1482 RepID=UPI000EF50ECF|nr:hypothetical protein [Virgibacillus halodenitrificans]